MFSKYFVGFSLYDTESREYIAQINGNMYFTPASNTKILTLASWLTTNRDSIPGFLLGSFNGTPVLRPLGDPTFLHPDFPDQLIARELASLDSDTLLIDYGQDEISTFGPGWAWDDYVYSYQPERSILPIYGNVVRVKVENEQYSISPSFFIPYIDLTAEGNFREPGFNLFNFSLDKYLGDSTIVDIPFVTSGELTQTLLTDTLYKFVHETDIIGVVSWDTVYSQHRIPVLALMMQRSDNFLAEQLLINAQLTRGFPTTEAFLRHLGNVTFRSVPDPLIWVDGSGLSRYNMFTPNSLVKILDIIADQLTWNEISIIFPTGGLSGTIRNWYRGDTPYVYAKTGTLRHNHSLSGYLLTKSGKTLIFSFMNNHYTFSSSRVKEEMQQLLERIRDRY